MRSFPQFAHHHQPAVDAGPQLHLFCSKQGCHAGLPIQGGPDGVFRIMLAGFLGSKERQQPIPQVLGDRPMVGRDRLPQCAMEPGDHLAPLLRVQFFRPAG